MPVNHYDNDVGMNSNVKKFTSEGVNASFDNATEFQLVKEIPLNDAILPVILDNKTVVTSYQNDTPTILASATAVSNKGSPISYYI